MSYANPAADLLTEAREVLTHASTQYDPNAQGAPERSFDRVATMFNAAADRKGAAQLSGRDIAEIQNLLKIVRRYSAPGYHHDSFVDGAGYTALAGELAARDAGHKDAP